MWNEAWSDALFFFFLNGHGVANVENPRRYVFFHELRAKLFITEDFLKFFWLTCLTNDFLAISHFSERKSGKKGIALWRGYSLWKVFFFNYLDLLPADLGPRPGRQHFYIYIYVCMLKCVLKTLRRMINIKVFYKKLYNHLDIYTNTQIYIHIYVYIFYNMAIEKSCNYVSNYLIINHIGLERRLNCNNKS